jgi:hypothetical protein
MTERKGNRAGSGKCRAVLSPWEQGAARRRRDQQIRALLDGAQDAGEGSLMRRRRILAGLILSLVVPLAAEAPPAGRVRA